MARTHPQSSRRGAVASGAKTSGVAPRLIENPGAEKDTGCAGVVGAVSAPATLFLELPAPPSTNALFKNVPGKGRVRTALYDTWLANAGWRLKAQRPTPVKGSVLILIGIERTNVLSDIDNRVKPTLDLLVKHKIIEDDRKVIGFAAAWNPARDGLMRVAIIPAGDVVVRFHLTDPGHGGWFLDGQTQEQEVA